MLSAVAILLSDEGYYFCYHFHYELVTALASLAQQIEHWPRLKGPRFDSSQGHVP